MAIEDVDLAEFNRCRDEIDNRTELSERIVLAEITVLGAGVPLLGKTYDGLLGLAAVSSLLWLFWLAHTQSISKLAGYIACQLAPRLRRHCGERVLSWEEYSRITHRDGPQAYKIPYRPQLPSVGHRTSLVPRNVAGFIFWWFGGATPVLLGVYSLVAVKYRLIAFKKACIPLDLSDAVSDARILMIILSLLIWYTAVRQYTLVAKTWTAIDEEVTRMASAPEEMKPITSQ